MLRRKPKQRILAKMRNACRELEQALNLPVAIHDPVAFPRECAIRLCHDRHARCKLAP